MTGPIDHFSDVVIRASAGSGKTYQLSNRFLGLVLAGEPFDTMLATTFTRKAAGEILDRVLQRLADAALDPEKLAQMAADVGIRLSRKQCLHMLRQMLHRLHRLRVGTLDSFFIQIARSFSLDLGLPPGWNIVDEIDDYRMRTEAIRTMLQEEKDTQGTVELMHMLTKGETDRSVGRQIGLLVNDLYGLFLEAPPEAWKLPRRGKPLGLLELQAALETLASVEVPPGKRYSNVRAQDLENATNERWEDFLSKGLGPKILDGSEAYHKKPIPEDLLAVYRPLVDHAKAEVLGQIANQTMAAQTLLGRFDAAYLRLKTSARAMRFEDVTRRLTGGDMTAAIDQIAYRLDAHVSHLLLDEFQDTSPQQWHVLRPFAERITGHARRSFFCVGDVKQAIYGWRGGVAEIFEALEDQLDGLTRQSLNKSWRSSQAVIDTVNRVFGNLATNQTLSKNHDGAADRWSARFTHHTTVHTDMPGHCRMIAAPAAAEGGKQDHVSLTFAAEQVATLHRAAPGAEIGVLVRKNEGVARLIYELRRKHKIDASEEGGNPLTDSPAVQLLLSLLTLVDHPGHTAARFYVAHSPLSESLGQIDEIRRRLAGDGYGTVLHQWTEELAPSVDHRDLSRLMQLVELAHGYDAAASTRTDDFVTMVCRKRVEDPTSANVRVMTIHQAKGLQFDVVVLPQLDARLVGQTPRFVVGRPSPTEPVQHVCRYVSEKLRPLLPRSVQQTFDRYTSQVVEESLCVLYVAMTRAVHALHVIVAPSRESEKNIPTSSAGLLRSALTDGQRAEPEMVLYEHGDSQWMKHVDLGEPVVATGKAGLAGAKRSGAPVEQESGASLRSATSQPTHASPQDLTIRLAKPAARPTRGLQRRSPSQLEGGPRVDLAEHLRLDTAAALDRGTLMHKWFEQIEWLDEGSPEKDTLLRVAQTLPDSGPDIAKLIGQFYQALQQPAIRAALTRTTYEQPGHEGSASAVHAGSSVSAPRWEVWRERPFAVRDGDAIVRGEIDRLVVLFDGQQPVAADVLDFKTDAVGAADASTLAARIEHYRPQLNAYRTAVASLYALSPQQVSARLAFVEPGLICVVAPARP